MRAALLIAISCLVGACRAHVLDDGTVTLAVSEVLTDGCGLGGTAAFPGSVTLTAAGHRLTGTASFLSTGVAGFYQPSSERFVLDGTLANVPLGRCQAEWVQWSLSGVGLAPDRLEGTLEVTASAQVATACTCQTIARVRGQR